jgi:hypothetical protein
MPLAQAIVDLIRDEIGVETDFVDQIADEGAGELASLEAIYVDDNRGNSDVLRTALICWRLRRNSYVSRGFDATAGGSLMARRQKMLEYDRRVKEYEILVDTTNRHRQSHANSAYEQNLAAGGTELS